MKTVNAGHPLPTVRPAEGRDRSAVPARCWACSTSSAPTQITTLRTGDTVVFYTDGVTDLPPPADLSEPELLAFLDALPPELDAGAIADAIRRNIVERVPDEDRRDDIAILVIHVADS